MSLIGQVKVTECGPSAGRRTSLTSQRGTSPSSLGLRLPRGKAGKKMERVARG